MPESLAIIRELAQELNIPIQVTDLSGNYIYANTKCLAILNLPDQPISTVNFYDLISDQDQIRKIFNDPDFKVSRQIKVRIKTHTGENDKNTISITFFRITSTDPESCKVAGIFNLAHSLPDQNVWAFEEILDKSAEAIIQLNPQWKLVEINKKGLEFTGYEKTELLGKKLHHLIDPAYLSKTLDFYRIQEEKRISTTIFEFPIHSKNGHQRWISQKLHILFDQHDQISGYLGLSSDITEMVHLKKQLSITDQVLEKRVNWRTKELERINNKLRNEITLRSATEEALRESQKEYKSLFQNANDAIIIIDAENENVLEVNDLACEMYQINREDFLNKSFRDTLGSKAASVREFISKTLNQKRYNAGEIIIKVGGREMTLDVHANEVIYKGRKAILSVNRDITTRKQIQKELLNEKTRGLTALIDGQEMERRRLSRELHDGLGQLLTTSMIYVKQLKKNIAPDSAEIVNRINDILENTMEEVRSISHNLLPSVLDDFGLPLAIKNMVNNLQKNNQTLIHLKVDESLPRLDPEVEVGLYRIAQEGLNNSLKHAKGAEIFIGLKQINEDIELNIRDTGKGFALNSNNSKKSGNGIANMAQRANSLGSEFTIRSNKGEGTEISVRYRMNHEQN